MALLSIVPDLHLKKDGYVFTNPTYKTWTAEATTPWLHVTEGSAATTLELKLDKVPPDTNFALMLSLGIRMGTPLAHGVDDIKHAGCGKVVRVL